MNFGSSVYIKQVQTIHFLIYCVQYVYLSCRCGGTWIPPRQSPEGWASWLQLQSKDDPGVMCTKFVPLPYIHTKCKVISTFTGKIRKKVWDWIFRLVLWFCLAINQSIIFYLHSTFCTGSSNLKCFQYRRNLNSNKNLITTVLKHLNIVYVKQTKRNIFEAYFGFCLLLTSWCLWQAVKPMVDACWGTNLRQTFPAALYLGVSTVYVLHPCPL